jgi:hypothetical protein
MATWTFQIENTVCFRAFLEHSAEIDGGFVIRDSLAVGCRTLAKVGRCAHGHCDYYHNLLFHVVSNKAQRNETFEAAQFPRLTGAAHRNIGNHMTP